MKSRYPSIRAMGMYSILIEFEPKIDKDILKKVLFYKYELGRELFKEEVEISTAYSSLIIIYPSTIESIYNELEAVKKIILEPKVSKARTSWIFHLPVCYDSNFGLDLELISKENQLSVEEIIHLHTSPIYTVYFIGFLPGFLYLGGLDEKLRISRKKTPRLQVQKGAVGIGENQTGIYPQSSPGGWQIIGNSPVPLFDPDSLPPCGISAGDKVQFHTISKEEYDRISAEVVSKTFRFRKKKL